jgi:DNA polymerase
MPLTNLLQSAGWPTDTLVLDFETYFDKDYTLKKMSMVEYVNDPRFEILGLAYKRNDEEAGFFTSKKWLGTLRRHIKYVAPARTIIMHNAYFDCLVFKKLGIRFPYVLDTRSMDYHFYARRPCKHSLDKLTKGFDLGTKGNTKDFMGLHADGDPEQLKALAEYACNDAELEYKLACRLAPFISNPKMELWLMKHTLDLFLDSPIDFDTDWANRLQVRMTKKRDRALGTANTTSIEVNSPAKLKARLEAIGIEVPMKRGKKGMIPAFAKTDEAYEKLLQHENPDVRTLMQARQANKTWPTQIKKIETLKRQAQANDGKLPIYLNYYSAGTGRWGGGDGTNLQNLSIRNSDRLMNYIRSTLIAPEGHVFVVVDASQIEARGVDWISGQEDFLELWRQGEDIYKKFASDIYKCSIKDITTKQRSAGKTGILGAGYGMGPNKLVAYAQNTFKLDVSFDEADTIVQAYRRTHPKVTKFWRDIENAFKFVLKYRTAKTPAEGRLTVAWVPDEDVLYIQLPSTRRLYYHHPRLRSSGDNTHISTEDHEKMWGGVLTENIVQAISRDILAENICVLEAQGLHVCLHVHDEVVLCVPEEYAESVLQQTIQVFHEVPEWADGWPLAGEGKIMRRYGK